MPGPTAHLKLNEKPIRSCQHSGDKAVVLRVSGEKHRSIGELVATNAVAHKREAPIVERLAELKHANERHVVGSVF